MVGSHQASWKHAWKNQVENTSENVATAVIGDVLKIYSANSFGELVWIDCGKSSILSTVSCALKSIYINTLSNRRMHICTIPNVRTYYSVCCVYYSNKCHKFLTKKPSLSQTDCQLLCHLMTSCTTYQALPQGSNQRVDIQNLEAWIHWTYPDAPWNPHVLTFFSHGFRRTEISNFFKRWNHETDTWFLSRHNVLAGSSASLLLWNHSWFATCNALGLDVWAASLFVE